MNPNELKRKRDEEKYKGLTKKQQRMMKKVDNEKNMRNAKKKAADKIIKRKAEEAVKKDMQRLQGDTLSGKVRAHYYKRILEIVSKISL